MGFSLLQGIDAKPAVADLNLNEHGETVEGDVSKVITIGANTPGIFAWMGDFAAPGLIICSTLCLIGFVLWVWYGARKEGLDGQKPRAVSAAATWLSMLSVASMSLLVLQVCMGYYFSSLTLLADSAHTAADAIGYGFAYIVERAKADISGGKGSKLTTWIDLLSAGFSVAVVLTTTGSAAWEAVDRLHSKGAQADTDFRYMGVALLSFAIVSTLMNVGLLIMHPSYVSKNEGEIVEETVPLMQPPPLDDECAPPPPPAGGVSRRQRRPKLQLLHMAFHAGCDGEHCIDQHGNASTTSSDVSPGTSQVVSADMSTMESMNLRGAQLHLITDVLRSIIIFVAGSLVCAGVITEPIRADAVCALLVGACVVIGSGMILSTMCRKIYSLAAKK